VDVPHAVLEEQTPESAPEEVVIVHKQDAQRIRGAAQQRRLDSDAMAFSSASGRRF
jgi:hypothetical protein